MVIATSYEVFYIGTFNIIMETSMSLIKRIWDIVRAFFSSILEHFENPEKKMNQMIKDYKEELFDIKQEADAAKNDLQKIRMRLSECDKAIASKKESAEFALRMGREDDARTSLIDKRIFEVTKELLEQDFVRLEKNVYNLQDCCMEVANVIKELEDRRDDVKDKMVEARRKNLINDVNSNLQNQDARDLLEAEMEIADASVKDDGAHALSLDEELESVKPVGKSTH